MFDSCFPLSKLTGSPSFCHSSVVKGLSFALFGSGDKKPMPAEILHSVAPARRLDDPSGCFVVADRAPRALDPVLRSRGIFYHLARICQGLWRNWFAHFRALPEAAPAVVRHLVPRQRGRILLALNWLVKGDFQTARKLFARRALGFRSLERTRIVPPPSRLSRVCSRVLNLFVEKDAHPGCLSKGDAFCLLCWRK